VDYASKNPPKKFLYVIQLLAAIAGVALSIYLLVQHTRLKSGIQGSQSFCSFGKYADCDVVNSSDYSEVFGLPIAAIGAGFYFLLLILACLAGPRQRNFAVVQRWVAWLTLPALLIDLTLFFIQVFWIKSFCVFCLFTYALTITILITSALLQERRGRGISGFFRDTFLENKPVALPSLPKASLALAIIAFILFAVIVSLLPSKIRQDSQSYTNIDDAMAVFFQQWKDKPTKIIEPRDGDGTFGNPNAKVRIVEFSDFECPFCQRAAFTMHVALKPLENRVFFIFKNYPLDSACNPAVSHQMHPNACALARLATCAARKGKFWEFHDAAFFSMSEDIAKKPDAIDQAKQTGLFNKSFTPGEIDACLADATTLKKVSDDIKMGNTLGLRGTPTVYINGKQVTIPLTPENIKKLVEIEAQ